MPCEEAMANLKTGIIWDQHPASEILSTKTVTVPREAEPAFNQKGIRNIGRIVLQEKRNDSIDKDKLRRKGVIHLRHAY